MSSKNTNITPAQIASLDLFDALCERAEADAEAMLAEVLATQGRDASRRFTGKLRAAIWTRDGGRCVYCERTIKGRWHADHVIPWSRGGRTVEANGAVACPSCNIAKSDKVW